MDMLRLTISPDDDGTCELHAEVVANGFTGRGSAWFDRIQLGEFASKLEQFPLPQEPRTEIQGGFWSKELKDKLEQCHLSISAYPIDSRGNLGVQVCVSTPTWEQDRPESRHSAQVELITTYTRMSAFAGQLARLALLQTSEAILESERA